MLSLVRISFLIIAFFISMFPVPLVFFPMAPYRLLHFMGFFYFILIIINHKYKMKDLGLFLNKYLLLLIFSVIVIIMNGSSDYSYAIIVLNIILTVASSFLLISLMKKDQRDFVSLCDTILITFLIQEIASVLMFILPGVYEFVVSNIQIFDDYSAMMYRDLIGFRIVGIGNMGWAAGANYGFCLILLTAVPFFKKSTIYKKRVLYVAMILLTIIIGVLSARTFLIFLVISFVMYLKLSEKGLGSVTHFFKIVIKYSIPIIVLMIPFLYLFIRFIDEDRILDTFSYAFELFINYSESGKLTANSLEGNNDFYTVLPETVKTWLIGDGIYSLDGSYYMGIDAGYIRQLFYFGIIGILLYWFCMYNLYRITANIYNERKIKIVIYTMFISCLILNYKGFIDMTFYVAIFYACGVMGEANAKNTMSICQKSQYYS